MGQEISLSHFNEGDFTRFHQKLEQETLLLEKLIAKKTVLIANLLRDLK